MRPCFFFACERAKGENRECRCKYGSRPPKNEMIKLYAFIFNYEKTNNRDKFPRN